jgi:hypothetical protein
MLVNLKILFLPYNVLMDCTTGDGSMALKIAYSNGSSGKQRRYPDSQSLLRKKNLRQTAKLFKVGARVLIDHCPATVIAYNIAEFGRWVSCSHPIMARLDSGELVYCRLTDLSNVAPEEKSKKRR